MRAKLAVVGLVCAAAALALPACSRPRTGSATADQDDDKPKKKGRVLEFNLSSGAPESGSGGFFGTPPGRTYPELLRALQDAEKDEDATGFFVRLGGARLGWSKTEELGRLFGKLRKQDKPVVCHAHELSNSSSWLAAAACDRIWLSPSGAVDTVGLAGQIVYLRGALDKVKVEVDFLHMGKYKSFAEQYTHEGPTDAARESLTGALGSIRSAWLSGVESARAPSKTAKASKNPVKKSLEDGPFSAQAAKERGLVDELGYESDAVEDVLERAGGKKPRVKFGPGAGESPEFSVADMVRVLTGADETGGGRAHVALVPAEGAIMMGAGGLFSSGGISARALTKTIRRLRKDKSVKAVVLRIDSPGGSALASDLLWHELRKLNEKKPLVASVGDMAASGGYYMACASQKIFAEKTSIVGSIGVVGGKFNVAPALKQYGVNAVAIPASPEPGAGTRATYQSLFSGWDDPTRERMRQLMQSMYDLFLDRVAKGRKKTVEEIKKVAEGRVWSGIQGKSNGLVDEHGGLLEAIAEARKLGDLDDKAPVVVTGGSDGLADLLGVSAGAREAEVRAALDQLKRRDPSPLERVGGPLRRYVAGLQPLLGGEHVLAILPFGLVVE